VASELAVGSAGSRTIGNRSGGLVGVILSELSFEALTSSALAWNSCNVDGELLGSSVAATFCGVCNAVSRIGLFVGDNFIVRIDRIAVARGCEATAGRDTRFAGAGNLEVTETIGMGVDLVTEDVTIRIGSSATSGIAQRRVNMPQTTRRRGLSQ